LKGATLEHNIISVSGGKDSTALLLLALERKTPNMLAVFADTGHEHAQTYEYIAYLSKQVFPIRTIKADFSKLISRKREIVQEKWPGLGVDQATIDRALTVLIPTGIPFLDLCIAKGRFPSTKARFCSEELKRNPIIEQVQKPILSRGEDIISWQGVRADESLARRDLPMNECKSVDKETGAELWNFRPIIQWTVEDVFAMHRKYDVLPNPLYSQGMGRVGCMPCIHARKDELLEISKRFPEVIDRLEAWEKLVNMANSRKIASFFATDKIPGADLEDGGIRQVIGWAKTGRGGRNLDMFRLQDDGPLCSSVYGLCE
jgi:3'-phosphoadenosine 5'-phosphosulfate sulfotransferase (PAPS reductase)/FAD synthetase